MSYGKQTENPCISTCCYKSCKLVSDRNTPTIEDIKINQDKKHRFFLKSQHVCFIGFWVNTVYEKGPTCEVWGFL